MLDPPKCQSTGGAPPQDTLCQDHLLTLGLLTPPSLFEVTHCSSHMERKTGGHLSLPMGMERGEQLICFPFSPTA